MKEIHLTELLKCSRYETFKNIKKLNDGKLNHTRIESKFIDIAIVEQQFRVNIDRIDIIFTPDLIFFTGRDLHVVEIKTGTSKMTKIYGLMQVACYEALLYKLTKIKNIHSYLIVYDGTVMKEAYHLSVSRMLRDTILDWIRERVSNLDRRRPLSSYECDICIHRYRCRQRYIYDVFPGYWSIVARVEKTKPLFP